jgi:hypothetical protein
VVGVADDSGAAVGLSGDVLGSVLLIGVDDGGFTWSKQALYSPWGVWGDPCIITDTSGRFFYFHLSV